MIEFAITLIVQVMVCLFFYNKGKKRGALKDKIKLEIIATPEQLKKVLNAIENNL